MKSGSHLSLRFKQSVIPMEASPSSGLTTSDLLPIHLHEAYNDPAIHYNCMISDAIQAHNAHCMTKQLTGKHEKRHLKQQVVYYYKQVAKMWFI
jgi:hypothetical protein